MKHLIQNTSLNRVLLALAVSVAAGGVASASPAGTVTATITTPAHYSIHSAASPVSLNGTVTVTPSGASATPTYSHYFVDSLRVKYPVGDNFGFPQPIYATPQNDPITFNWGNGAGGTVLTPDYYSSHFDCTLSASGKTNVPCNVTDYFKVQ